MNKILNNTRPPLTFNRKHQADFHLTLRQRVDQYFKENNISRHANTEMRLKSVIILSLFFMSYGLLLSNWFTDQPFALLFLTILYGFSTALIGLNIAHDAVHGAYSGSTKANKWIGLSFNMVGANDFMWKCTHNVMHHTHTNVVHYDADIDQVPIIRLNPHQDLWWIHRFQHIYIFVLYGFTSFAWIFFRDFIEFFHPKINAKAQTKRPVFEFLRLIFFKILHYSIFLVIPFFIIDVSWQYFLIGFLIMHLVEGLTLALIFQLAHVTEGAKFPLPNQEHKLDYSWAAHQLETTANFGTKNNFLNYIAGGLNFQIEHHLFPTICHVHYKHIAPIVESTAKEFGLPYHNHTTYMDALNAHINQLKIFGGHKLEAN